MFLSWFCWRPRSAATDDILATACLVFVSRLRLACSTPRCAFSRSMSAWRLIDGASYCACSLAIFFSSSVYSAVRTSSRDCARLSAESSCAVVYSACAFCKLSVTSASFVAAGDRSSSAITSPVLTTEPSGTIDAILVWYTLTDCAAVGPCTCTNLRARSSPVVVTTTLKVPDLTGALRPASAADADVGHLYQATGPPMISVAASNGSQRERSCGISRRLGWERGTVGSTSSSQHVSTGMRELQLSMHYDSMSPQVSPSGVARSESLRIRVGHTD